MVDSQSTISNFYQYVNLFGIIESSILATWPSGKARVCKTLITGSNPVVASEESEPLSSLFFSRWPRGSR